MSSVTQRRKSGKVEKAGKEAAAVRKEIAKALQALKAPGDLIVVRELALELQKGRPAPVTPAPTPDPHEQYRLRAKEEADTLRAGLPDPDPATVQRLVKAALADRAPLQEHNDSNIESYAWGLTTALWNIFDTQTRGEVMALICEQERLAAAVLAAEAQVAKVLAKKKTAKK